MILGLVQARTSSKRLPNKVLLPILGQPMLQRQIERLLRVRRMDCLSVATSDDAGDDAIESLCDALQLPCFRGSLDDVLDRFYQAALPHAPTHVVRLTGDCPLCDPAIIDRVIQSHLTDDNDYTSNAVERSFPDGLDVEVIRQTALAQAWREARLPSEREHVTPYINQQPERFKLGAVKNDRDLSALRWSVDEPADLGLVRRIYESLYPDKPDFDMAAILALLESQPEINALNAHIEINQGLRKSRDEDARFLEQERDRDA